MKERTSLYTRPPVSLGPVIAEPSTHSRRRDTQGENNEKFHDEDRSELTESESDDKTKEPTRQVINFNATSQGNL
ncbi:hypothetical protein HYFRA_00005874 [Hymenoscyphus fraxineus]|uniref:Uncharacterized protein n=1 Tax=Hymenoscyphus fraxineus TaxID=746836 RepID=A0A9N9KUQ5_9HELO|nr:hypothetical protein HYFRA_00005874 [Hymenoscyphus fraxineus]